MSSATSDALAQILQDAGLGLSSDHDEGSAGVEVQLTDKRPIKRESNSLVGYGNAMARANGVRLLIYWEFQKVCFRFRRRSVPEGTEQHHASPQRPL